MIILIKYGIGYAQIAAEITVEDDATDVDIESDVGDYVTERLDWSWSKAP